MFAVVRLLLHAPGKVNVGRPLSHRSTGVLMWGFYTSRNDVQGGSDPECGISWILCNSISINEQKKHQQQCREGECIQKRSIISNSTQIQMTKMNHKDIRTTTMHTSCSSSLVGSCHAIPQMIDPVASLASFFKATS